MSHTPGPWTLKKHPITGKPYTDHGSDWLFGPDGKPIIHFHQPDYDSEAWYDFEDADAHLLAAAPDLLEACKATLYGLRDMTTEQFERGEDCKFRYMLEAAISKTEGKS